MDVQGAEVAALAGFRQTLARLKPRWMLIEFSPEHLRGAGSTPEAFWTLLDEPRLRALGIRRCRKDLSDRGYGGVYPRV